MDNKRDLSPVVTQADPEDWVNETDIGHNAAPDNINA